MSRIAPFIAPDREYTGSLGLEMVINRSVEYINRRGSGLEKARLHRILYGTSSEFDAIQEFVQHQNADGGFPCGMVGGNLITINDTTVALRRLEELDMLVSEQAEKAFG